MSRTAEQRAFRDKLRTLIDAAGLPRPVRIVADAEGFPIVPGRLGQVEWLGAEWRTGEDRLFVFTPRRGVIPRVLAIPGIRRHQMGDGEARMWFPAHDVECLSAVLRVIRARVRRLGGGRGNLDALSKARAVLATRAASSSA